MVWANSTHDLCGAARENINRRGGGVLQWLRYRDALDSLLSYEQETGTYHHVIKRLRTDFLFTNPHLLLGTERELAGWWLLAQTDLVFGGRREVMFALRGMFDAGNHFFYGRTKAWFPLNLHQILASDRVIRWNWSRVPYAALFPQPARGPDQIEAAILNLQDERKLMGAKVSALLTPGSGNEIFPLERVFAQYLNFLNIPALADAQFEGSLSLERFDYAPGHENKVEGSNTSGDKPDIEPDRKWLSRFGFNFKLMVYSGRWGLENGARQHWAKRRWILERLKGLRSTTDPALRQ